ncbi:MULTISPECIES: hypothetical protein [Sphingobacterium]|uniref:hypothetical protein n=1 Tax=Sphingobacterium TaxID=28453 RepID=UPI00257C3AC6|nr:MULTISPECIES: hypothetical protein [Sphingobacterium]
MKQFPIFIVISGLIAAFFLSGVINKTLSESIFGNVADWTMVLVTIGTVYFLYETLQSQKDVQRDQEQINRLQTVQIRKEFKPNLRLINLAYQHNTYSFAIEIVNNPVHHFKISSEVYFHIDTYQVPRKEDEHFSYEISRITNGNIPVRLINIPFNQNNFTEIDNVIGVFKLFFEDEFGFKYSKIFQIEYNSQTYQLTHRSTNDVFII